MEARIVAPKILTAVALLDFPGELRSDVREEVARAFLQGPILRRTSENARGCCAFSIPLESMGFRLTAQIPWTMIKIGP
jgi:hypothetical protein